MKNQEHFLGSKVMVNFARLSFGAITAQLATLIFGFVVIAVFGNKPQDTLGYLTIFRENALIGLMRDEFHLVVMISLYIFSFCGLFFLTMRKHFNLAFIAFVITIIAAVLNISSHSGFSLLHLSELYWAAPDDVVRSQLLAAGQAMIAKDMWNSTTAFFSGLFLQGGGILMSLAMIGCSSFRKITWISGLIANGFDLVNHLIHYFAPGAAEIFLLISGPFYILWFVMMALDLLKYIRHQGID